MRDFLRVNDPASVDGLRAEKMMSVLWGRLDEQTSQTAFFFAPSSFAAAFPVSLPRFFAMAALFLVMGFFVGNGLAASRPAAEERISMYAMAEPWESLIVEEP